LADREVPGLILFRHFGRRAAATALVHYQLATEHDPDEDHKYGAESDGYYDNPRQHPSRRTVHGGTSPVGPASAHSEHGVFILCFPRSARVLLELAHYSRNSNKFFNKFFTEWFPEISQI
jgi:hypothetical protein